MADKSITYIPPHCEDIATTLTTDEFDALFKRLIRARRKRPKGEQRKPVGNSDTKVAHKKASPTVPQDEG